MGLCSFDYRLEYRGQKASSLLNHWGESGSLRLEGRILPIRKGGFFSGRWTLYFDGTELATAQKTGLFSRTSEVTCGDRHLLVHGESLFSRAVRIEENDRLLGRVVPVHPFTKRASMEVFQEEEDFILLAFLFWLVQMTWRRRAHNSRAT